jgi:hypothetical protein
MYSFQIPFPSLPKRKKRLSYINTRKKISKKNKLCHMHPEFFLLWHA